MKQYILVSLFVLSFLLYGCSAAAETEKLQDLEFTIIDEKNIPNELKTIIEQKKEGEFKLTYANEQDLYIVVGYGAQTTGGYSIEVAELYLTKENIIIDTNLIGPEGDAVVQTSYPYVVVKTEWREEPVLYQ
ncbi:MAG: protease complex subunit PrcB family protein [Clostridiales bacterium]|nr:protease complex subunit PrcB family protein [Clostridiales bacterium]